MSPLVDNVMQEFANCARTSPMSLTEDLVALCNRPEPDPGLDPETVLFTDAEYEVAASQILASHGSDPVWVFAYGSLLWKPAQPGLQWRIVTTKGWHRSASAATGGESTFAAGAKALGQFPETGHSRAIFRNEPARVGNADGAAN